MSVQAWMPPRRWRSSTSRCWLRFIVSTARSTSAGSAWPDMAAAKSTPVPRGRLSSSASPACSPRFGQGVVAVVPVTLNATCSPRLAGSGVGLRASSVCPPSSAAPWSCRTDRMPERVCASSSCCSSAATAGRVTTAIAWSARAPQAQRSEQACSVVSRALSQGSLTSAGNPSTLWRRVGASLTRAASSAEPLSPACSSAANRGAAGSLAAQPRQAMAAIVSRMDGLGRKPAMNA